MVAERYAQEALRIIEKAAIQASRYVGKGDKNAADQAAVNAMRSQFEKAPFCGEVVIGEGEKDEAPMLYIGERMGARQEPVLDVAVDPLEGTTLTANGARRSLCVMALGPEGSFLHAPDVYMMKLCVGPEAQGTIDLDADFETNIRRVADAKNMELSSLTCVLLDRDRNEEYIRTLRALDCRVRLVEHGDISAALSACVPETEVDMLAGIGNSAEGVLSAAAAQCFEGDFEGRLNPIGTAQHERLDDMDFDDHARKFNVDELAGGDEMVFACSGVTDGDFLKGVHVRENELVSHSLLITTEGVRRIIESRHIEPPINDENDQPPLPGLI
jgi:fructose-1,6-bisphosphatase II